MLNNDLQTRSELFSGLNPLYIQEADLWIDVGPMQGVAGDNVHVLGLIFCKRCDFGGFTGGLAVYTGADFGG